MRWTTRIPVFAAILGNLSSGLVACEKKVDTTLAEEQSQNPTALFQNGVLLLRSPDKTGSIDYTTAYQRFTASAELFDAKGDKESATKAHFNAGWVAQALGQTSDAERHFRAAHEADPAYDKAMFSLAEVLTEEAKHPEAIALYRSYVDAHPDNVEVQNELIAALATAGMYPEAIAAAEKILLHDPKNATAYRNLSAMYYKQGNYGMSQLCAEKSLQLNEGDPGSYNNLGVTLLLQEDEAGAIEKFKTAIKLDTDNFEANMNLGFVALNSGDYLLALQSFEQATASDATNVDAKLGLAVALRGQGEYDKAGALYDQVIKLDPKNETAYFNAATLNERYIKDYPRALKYLQAYADQKTGTIGPDHEVFARMEGVKVAEAAEKAQKAELARLEAEKKARDERAMAALKEVDALASTMRSKIETNKSCLDPMMIEELNMMLEQAAQVVESKDTGMAGDVKSMFTDYYGPMLEEAVATVCAGAAPPAPAPEGGDTPPAETPPAASGTPGTP